MKAEKRKHSQIKMPGSNLISTQIKVKSGDKYSNELINIIKNMKKWEKHKKWPLRLECRGASYRIKYPEPGSRLASWNINVPSLDHVSD